LRDGKVWWPAWGIWRGSVAANFQVRGLTPETSSFVSPARYAFLRQTEMGPQTQRHKPIAGGQICKIAKTPFRLQHPDEWKRVTYSIGQPVGMDAALVSYLHHWRLPWSSFFLANMIPQIQDNLHLNQVLDKHRVARTPIYSDAPPCTLTHVAGTMMSR